MKYKRLLSGYMTRNKDLEKRLKNAKININILKNDAKLLKEETNDLKNQNYYLEEELKLYKDSSDGLKNLNPNDSELSNPAQIIDIDNDIKELTWN